ncbi:MAG: YkgJ family cysteine cluster protein [Armatimonadota bacterium]|nr:YkgJ family cysteine cluster protein [bacterium]
MAIDEEITRTGECRQCGECCRRLGWLLVHADDDTLEWLRARDTEIKVVPDEDVREYYWVSIPYPCTHLVDMGNGVFHCDMHDTKPEICKRYPEPTDDLKPGCGYRFTKG